MPEHRVMRCRTDKINGKHNGADNGKNGSDNSGKGSSGNSGKGGGQDD